MKIKELINQLSQLPDVTKENVDVFIYDREFDVYNMVNSWNIKQLFYVPTYYGNDIKDHDDVMGEDGTDFIGLFFDVE